MVTAVGGGLLSFDNISAIPVWLSDCLCRLSTGGAYATRGLYTNTPPDTRKSNDGNTLTP
jgi:putative DNA primase/helicase